MLLREAALPLVICVLFVTVGCGGRDHAIHPTGKAHVEAGTEASGATDADDTNNVTNAKDANTSIDTPPATTDHSDALADIHPATTDHSDTLAGCPADMKDCAGGCIAKDACCLDKDCAGVCQRCGANHVCGAATGQDDPNGRCTGTCDPGGACKSKQGQSCTTSSATGCIAGTSCVDGVCCGTPTCPACNHCNLNGAGTCSPAPAGADQSCPINPQNCSAGCDGAGRCQPAPKDTACGATTCAGSDTVEGVPHVGLYASVALTEKTCDGANAGTAACRNETTDCLGYICADGTTCKVACTTDSDCMLGYRCYSGSCIRKQPVGTICAANFLCSSSICSTTTNDPTMKCRECDYLGATCPLDKPYCGDDGVCHPCQAQATDACNADGSYDCLARTGGDYAANATTCNANHHLSCGTLPRCAPWMACVSGTCKVRGGRPCLKGSDCVTGICLEGTCKLASICQACQGHDEGDCDSSYCAPRAFGWVCIPPGGAPCP